MELYAVPSLSTKNKILSTLAKGSLKIEIKLSRSALFHMKLKFFSNIFSLVVVPECKAKIFMM